MATARPRLPPTSAPVVAVTLCDRGSSGLSLTLVVGLETLLRYQESKQRRTGHSDEDPRKTLTANESGKSEGRTEGGTEIPMIRPQKPKRERERVADLFALNLLDTPPEERYDRLTRELAVLLKVPIAYLALIDSNRQWLKSTVGTMPCQSDRDASFCAQMGYPLDSGSP